MRRAFSLLPWTRFAPGLWRWRRFLSRSRRAPLSVRPHYEPPAEPSTKEARLSKRIDRLFDPNRREP